jgi:YD repeat-containing protein
VDRTTGDASDRYVYDRQNRMLAMTEVSAAGVTASTAAWVLTYDSYGNRQGETRGTARDDL